MINNEIWRNKVRSCLIAFVFIFAFFGCKPKETAKVYEYDPAIVSLAGKIQSEVRSGPPNYLVDPKKDQNYTIYVLVLDEAINVQGKSNSDFNYKTNNDVKNIQLAYSGDRDFNYKQYLGKHVSVTGSLCQQVIVVDFTDVIISVKEIKEE